MNIYRHSTFRSNAVKPVCALSADFFFPRDEYGWLLFVACREGFVEVVELKLAAPRHTTCDTVMPDYAARLFTPTAPPFTHRE
ncbi:unnamed protein product, partial [Mesorhabditis spiculigera]